jgi:hypothetical protein
MPKDWWPNPLKAAAGFVSGGAIGAIHGAFFSDDKDSVLESTIPYKLFADPKKEPGPQIGITGSYTPPQKQGPEIVVPHPQGGGFTQDWRLHSSLPGQRALAQAEYGPGGSHGSRGINGSYGNNTAFDPNRKVERSPMYDTPGGGGGGGSAGAW